MRPGQAEPRAKGQLPGWGWRHWQGPELDRGLWSHSDESSFCPRTNESPVEVWTSGRKTTKKKSPFRFSLIHRSHLILSLWSCLHPTVFLFLFHSGRTGIYLKFSLPPETPSKPELPHTDTQPIWLIISGVSVAHAQSFRSSCSSPCYKWAPSGPERSRLWEGLSWVKRTGYNWIMKWEAEGQVAQVCPYCPSH